MQHEELKQRWEEKKVIWEEKKERCLEKEKMSLSEFAKEYTGSWKVQPYQENLLEKIEGKLEPTPTQIEILPNPAISNKDRVFNYFYEHWRMENQPHKMGQACKVDCPICNAITSMAKRDKEFLSEEEMSI